MKPQRLATWLLLIPGCLAGCASLPTRQELASLPGPQSEMPAGASLVDGRARFRDIFCGVHARNPAPSGEVRACSDWLWKLDDEPPSESRPLPDADRGPQVYLVSGAFSECLGDEARPFNSAQSALVNAGYRIATIVVSGRSGSEYNAGQIARILSSPAPGEEGPVMLIGYSKGANDILEFLVSYPEIAKRVESVVSIAGAIGGSPLASQSGGLYDALFDWIPSDRCPPGDGKVVDSLREEARRDWLAEHPLPPNVRYFSVAAFTTRAHMSAALVPAWELLLKQDRRNDGQLLARAALIPGSTLLGYLNADHWSAAIDVESVHPILGSRPDPAPFPRTALLEAVLLQVAELRRPLD
ncbi:MAG: hypothetical protein OEV41_05220 [Gammaproteobacteria bacterium]|nr:hypothetical protein [Gammaproteobacteria bacterium]